MELKQIFAKLSKYLVFYNNDGEREKDFYMWFENDIIHNNGADVIETISTLKANNEILAFPHLADLSEIENDVKHAVFLLDELNKHTFVKQGVQ